MSKLKIERSIFPLGWNHKFTDSLSISNSEISHLTDALIKIMSLWVLEKEDLINVAGQLSNEELLAIKGELGRNEFTYSLKTKYIGRTKNGNVRHELIERQDNLPDFIDKTELAALFPGSVNTLRLGIRFFHNKMSLMNFGRFAVVNQCLSLDVSDNLLSLNIQSEGLKSKNKFPEEHVFFTSICDLLLEEIGYSVENTYFLG